MSELKIHKRGHNGETYCGRRWDYPNMLPASITAKRSSFKWIKVDCEDCIKAVDLV